MCLQPCTAVDYHTGFSCTGRDTAYALSRVIANRCPKWKIRVPTDNGAQLTSLAFEPACKKLLAVQERIPNSIDHIEAFICNAEEECLQRHEFSRCAEACSAIMKFMRYLVLPIATGQEP